MRIQNINLTRFVVNLATRCRIFPPYSLERTKTRSQLAGNIYLISNVVLLEGTPFGQQRQIQRKNLQLRTR